MARSAIQQVGVRIDEAGRNQPAARVDGFAPRVGLGQVCSRSDRHDAALVDGDGATGNDLDLAQRSAADALDGTAAGEQLGRIDHEAVDIALCHCTV
jgi:hypothetical protein